MRAYNSIKDLGLEVRVKQQIPKHELARIKECLESKEPLIRRAAAYVLSEALDPGTSDIVISALSKEGNVDVSLLLVSAAAGLNDRRAVDHIVSLMRYNIDNETVVLHSILALKHLKDRRALPALLKLQENFKYQCGWEHTKEILNNVITYLFEEGI
ncbi:MAG: HEAT repeat domain-containing protein [Candidatus Micrarchaeia archaeon]